MRRPRPLPARERPGRGRAKRGRARMELPSSPERTRAGGKGGAHTSGGADQRHCAPPSPPLSSTETIWRQPARRFPPYQTGWRAGDSRPRPPHRRSPKRVPIPATAPRRGVDTAGTRQGRGPMTAMRCPSGRRHPSSSLPWVRSHQPAAAGGDPTRGPAAVAPDDGGGATGQPPPFR